MPPILSLFNLNRSKARDISRRSLPPQEPMSSSQASARGAAFDPFDVEGDPPPRPELTREQVDLCRDALPHFEVERKGKGKGALRVGLDP
jgi:hypothetical protein